MQKIDKVSKAKAILGLDRPFWGSLLMRKPSIEHKEPVPIDLRGEQIHYSQKALEQYDTEEVTTIMANIGTKIAFLHHTRIFNKDINIANAASHYIVNPILKENGFKLPKDALIDPRFDPNKQNFEDVYKILEEEVKSGKSQVNPPPGAGSGQGSGEGDGEGGGEGEEEGEGKGGGQSNPKAKQINLPSWGNMQQDSVTSTKSGRERVEAETKVEVLQAATTAKNRGKLPAAFESLIEEFKEPKVNWKEKLRQFVGGNKPDDWSYRRASKKAMAMLGAYLPTIEYTGAGRIVIGVDSSGSVGNAEMEQFFGEMKAIKEEMFPDDLWIVWCDAAIHKVQHFAANDEMLTDPEFGRRYGGGGTTLYHVFDWIEEEGVMPDSVVMLTDLYIGGEDMNYPKPHYPVMWVSTGAKEAPFGEVVPIDIYQ